MINRAFKTLLLAAMIACLSGCMFRSAEELFAIPRTSDTYQNLQESIQRVMGGATAISPISGNNTQSVQLLDLDGDGRQEAVAFYRDSSTERPLKIAIFKQNDREQYQLYTQIEGAGTDIESIDYRNLMDGDELEILVSWQVTPTVHTLTAYSVRERQVDEILRTGYTRYVATDMNGDAREELLLIQLDSSSQTPGQVELYVGSDGIMEFHSAASLSQGILSLQLWEARDLLGEAKGLMVTSEWGDNRHITDIFCLSETGLRNRSEERRVGKEC